MWDGVFCFSPSPEEDAGMCCGSVSPCKTQCQALARAAVVAAQGGSQEVGTGAAAHTRWAARPARALHQAQALAEHEAGN